MLKKFAYRLARLLAESVDYKLQPRFLTHDYRLGCLLTTTKIDAVIDIGANVGSFAAKLRTLNFHGLIVSFEPLSKEYEILAKRAASDPKWYVAPRMAIGAINGTSKINVAGNNVSSSLLPMNQRHLEMAPQSAYVAVEEIDVRRISDIDLHTWVPANSRLFLKADVQGFELQVLEGAERILKSIHGMQLETSFEELYDNQALFDELYDHVKRLGFRLHSMTPAMTDEKTGQLLQAMLLLIRPPAG
jgi:FkbM family methyltransferase